MACLVVLADGDAFDLATLFEVLCEHLLVDAEVDVLHEAAALIWVFGLLGPGDLSLLQVGVFNFPLLGLFLRDGRVVLG